MVLMLLSKTVLENGKYRMNWSLLVVEVVLLISLELDIAIFDLHATFTDVVNLIKPVAACKRLSVMVSLAPELPACAIGDRKLLMQIMLNVAGNSIKFTKEGHVSIASIARVPGGEFSGSCRLPGGRFIDGGGFSASGGLSMRVSLLQIPYGGFNGGSGIWTSQPNYQGEQKHSRGRVVTWPPVRHRRMQARRRPAAGPPRTAPPERRDVPARQQRHRHRRVEVPAGTLEPAVTNTPAASACASLPRPTSPSA
ncbi:hypothetical protein ZWY2020_005718 [Hordeum vulgare]|nr:hypothetical protein ZWY2020_005718 [Hordeum vulgare]